MEKTPLEEIPQELISPTSQGVQSYSSRRQETSKEFTKANSEIPMREDVSYQASYPIKCWKENGGS